MRARSDDDEDITAGLDHRPEPFEEHREGEATIPQRILPLWNIKATIHHQ